MWHPTKMYGPNVFLLPEYCDILYNPTHFPGPLVCRIRPIPLYVVFWYLIMEMKQIHILKMFKKRFALFVVLDYVFKMGSFVGGGNPYGEKHSSAANHWQSLSHKLYRVSCRVLLIYIIIIWLYICLYGCQKDELQSYQSPYLTLFSNNLNSFRIDKYIYTIFDLICDNGFLRGISHWRRSLRCKMRREFHFEQNYQW